MSLDLLDRLHPEDVHPARLAGPHAWARWGLGPPPLADVPLRFAVPPGTHDETIDRILGAMQDRLQRASWPPRPPLQTTRTRRRIEVTDGAAHTEISLEFATTLASSSARPAGAVSDPMGWFILDETAALAERLRSNESGEDVNLLEDLARWAALKGDAIGRRPTTELSIPTVLAELRRRAPEAHARLDATLAILDGPEPPNPSRRLDDGLRYLRDEAASLQRTRTPRRAPAMR